MPTWHEYNENPGDNNSPPPVGAPEGGYQGRWVNDTLRYMMAVIRDLGASTPKVPPGRNPDDAVGSMAYQSANDVNITGGTIASEAIAGLGSAAFRNVGSSNGNVVALDSSGRIARARLSPFQGSTSTDGGLSGVVPPPSTGQRTSFLAGDGGWRQPTLWAFEDWRDTWSANTVYTYNHGFVNRPHLAWVEFQAKSPNNGFLAGEVIQANIDYQQYSGGSHSGISIAKSDTAVRYRIHSNGYAALGMNGSSFNPSSAGWRMRAVAMIRY